MTKDLKSMTDRLAQAREREGGQFVLATRLPEEKGFKLQMDAPPIFMVNVIRALCAEMFSAAATKEECLSVLATTESVVRVAVHNALKEIGSAEETKSDEIRGKDI